MEVEQPYCLVITLPSSPWNVWSLLNEGESPVQRQRIHARRLEHRPYLRQANASVERITAGFHVFLEHPLGSEVFDQPAMSCLAVLVHQGILHVCRIDGCAVGYRYPDSNGPYLKPMIIVTSMDVLADALRSRRCQCRCSHEQLHGQNLYGSKTLQVAEWSFELNNIVATSIR